MTLNVVNNAMKKSKRTAVSPYRASVLRVSKAHFFYVLAVSVFVLQYDAWKLITPEAALQRWTVACVMLVVVTLCWFAARQQKTLDTYYQAILATIIVMDIYVAAFSVFSQRGMASRGVALFAIPIIVAATASRAAIFATAALSLAAYWFASVRYFNLYPSEGYRVELYSDLTFYGATFFVIAALLYIVISKSKTVD